MRIAGGSVLPSRKYSRLRPGFFSMSESENEEKSFFTKLKYQLLPGSALVERPDLLEKRLDLLRQEQPEANVLDAWLSCQILLSIRPNLSKIWQLADRPFLGGDLPLLKSQVGRPIRPEFCMCIWTRGFCTS